jgi:hypothetical protein
VGRWGGADLGSEGKAPMRGRGYVQEGSERECGCEGGFGGGLLGRWVGRWEVECRERCVGGGMHVFL